MKGVTVRVELSGTELGDADLASLVKHLDSVMQHYVGRTDGKYILNIDLSCNLFISDDGITEHLAPFLQRWPVCHRLKLYKTSIGDGALIALGKWAAGGYAHELHFSDLGGQVTGDAVFGFLEEVHQKGNYPYWNSDGERCSLWLRLEHNAVPNTDKLVSRAQSQGMSLSVLQKPDLGQVRPGTPGSQSTLDVPAMNLVLFHKQELRVSRQWIGSMVRMAPVSQELQKLVGVQYGAPLEHSPGLKTHEPSFLAKFLGPSQRCAKQAQDRNGSNTRTAVANGEVEIQGRSNKAVNAVVACPTGADDEVLRRWRCHVESASDPEKEARRILRMTAKLCDTGYLDQNSAEMPPSVAHSIALTDCSPVRTSDPVTSDGSARLARKPEGEDSNDDVVISLGVGPPVPPTPARALVAAPCA